MRLFCQLVPVCALIAVCAAAEEAATSPRVHAFYYNWYANPETDGAYSQWNHRVMLRGGQGTEFTPPEQIGANFYPAHGLYSSNDPVATGRHMEEMKAAGAGVVAVTWWGVDSFTDRALDTLFAAAADHGLKVCFHIEPFPGRDALSTRAALVYLIGKYGGHPALYRDPARGRNPTRLENQYAFAKACGAVFGAAYYRSAM